MMDRELEHVLRTYSDHEVIGEQGSLRDLLTCLRSLAEELQLDFEEALTESAATYQDRLLQAFDRAHDPHGGAEGHRPSQREGRPRCGRVAHRGVA
jgi:hypothetical protein